MATGAARRTAIVTGATRGIGLALAVGLARLGYDVAVTGRTRSEGDLGRRAEAVALPELRNLAGSLERTAALVEAEGVRAVPLVLDLLERDTLVPVAQAAIEALGHVDVLVNNAIYVGPAGELRFCDTPADEIERRVYGNLTAQLVFTQPILRHMVSRGSGTIADITTAAAYRTPRAAVGEGGWALTYGVSKAGFHRFAAQLVAEHGRDGVQFLNLQPGMVATERVLAAGEKLAFVARHAAPVDVIGAAAARIVDNATDFDNGATIEVADLARTWGML